MAAPRVAIVHDWLVGGGAERVVYELHKLYPEAPIYTSYCTPEWREKLDNKVVTGFLQNWPFGKLRKFLPVLRMWWFSRLDLSQFDLVISSTGNGEAFGIRVPTGTAHVCYCHTPTHYYWRHYDRYMQNPGFGVFNPLVRLSLKLLVSPLRKWDYSAAQRVDYFIANSTHIKNDIQQYYGRDAVIIHPPVSVERFNTLPPRPRQGFVTVGRQVPLKRTDIAVEACTKLGLSLKVLGSGPEHDKLVRLAGPTVTFIEKPSDEEVASALASAKAFLFASFEDFGITPVEALAAGTPVIAYQAGGAPDYVIPGKTGVFFKEQTTKSLVTALQTFNFQEFNETAIKKHAEQFSNAHFSRKVQDFLQKLP